MMDSTPFYYRRTTCRLCGSADLECVVELKPSALAEWYLPPARAQEAATRYPMDLFLCHGCGHVQLCDVINPERLFSNYVYTSASSPGLENHFCQYADHVVKKLGLEAGTLAVDVGSNDGTLLRQFAKHGLRVCGIDPAQGIAQVANEAGIPTLCAFMTPATARIVAQDFGTAALCTANNVFAHSDDLGEMAEGIASMLAPDGVFVFEVSYLRDTIEGLVFDFIYHEHLCYHSVRPMAAFLQQHGLELFDVEHVPSKGGSLRGYAQRTGGPRVVSPHVAEFIIAEEASRLYDPATYRQFAARINSLRDQAADYLRDRRAEGAIIAGYGASATVTTLLHHFELGELIDFLVDDNPIRFGTASPGFQIPVFPPAMIYERKPAVVVLTAWRFGTQIMERHRAYLAQGGVFLSPLPAFHEYKGPSK